MKFRSLSTRFHRAEEIDESGFTLIELLIVVVIMGILAAVVAFAVGSFASTSAAAACNTDAKSVQTAVAAFYAQEGKYPTATTDLVGSTSPGGPYLHSWPSNSTYAISLNTGTPGEVDVTLTAGDPGVVTGTGGLSDTTAYNFDLTGATSPYATTSTFTNDNVCAGA